MPLKIIFGLFGSTSGSFTQVLLYLHNFQYDNRGEIKISRTPDRDFRLFYSYEKILSHIPSHTRLSDPN